MGSIFKYFVYGSWWVSLCASALGLLTWFELTGDWINWPLAIFIAGATLVIYNLNMLTGLKELKEMGTDSERHHWCLQNERPMKLTLVIGLLLSVSSVWFLNPTIWLLMLPLAFISMTYVIPIVKKKADKIRIREIGLWKIFVIAIVWAGMTALLPAVHLYGFKQITEALSWQLALERAVFILAITIPFDIRDLVNDAKKKVKTIPSILGWKPSVLLSILLMLLFAGMTASRLEFQSSLLQRYFIGIVLTITILLFASPKRNDMYCSFWLEGTMMIQFLGIILLN